MTDIRPLQRDDLPAVASMLRANLPGWDGDEQFLAVQTLDHPWSSDEFPSLVAVEPDGKLIGFIGAQVRRMRLDGSTISGVCCTQLAVDEGHHTAPVGAFLLKRMLSGTQEVTWSDSSTDAVVRMWSAFGGHSDHTRACDWMLVLRPFRWAGGAIGALTRRRAIRRDLVPVAALPLQAAGRRLLPATHPDPPADVSGGAATSAEIVESLPAITKGLRLWVDHDVAHLDHMFGELERFYGAAVVRRVVRKGERPIGWYAYVPLSSTVSQVLHLACSEREAEPVLAELAAHSLDSGTAVLSGRAEPHLGAALGRRFAVLGFARHPIVHTTGVETAALLATESSLLTRLDGEPFAA